MKKRSCLKGSFELHFLKSIFLFPYFESVKAIEKFVFRNWAGCAQSCAQKYFQPQTEHEIALILKEAAESGKKIRVVGAGHSWSPLVCTDDYLLNLDFFNNIISIDKPKKQIRVQAGIRLRQLNKVLEDVGLSLVNLGSVSEQSLAGLTATGTHGTGIRFQILSSAIIGMKVLKADGEILKLEEDDPLLDAYRVSLGLLGIITEITLQCTDAFNLKEESEPMQFDKALGKLPELLQENEHLKLWWFPHVSHLMVYRYNRTKESAQSKSVFIKWLEEVLLARYFFALVLRIGNAMPSRIPAINRFIKNLHLKKISRVGKSYEIFNVPMPPKHRESEYAVPVEHAAAALRELREEIERNRMKVNFVVEVRFVKGDKIWLSPAYGRNSCYIGGYLYGDKRWTAYFGLFEKLMKKYDGRPHWGKEFTPGLNEFGKMYEKLGEFLKLKENVDVNDIFENKLTEEIMR